MAFVEWEMTDDREVPEIGVGIYARPSVRSGAVPVVYHAVVTDYSGDVFEGFGVGEAEAIVSALNQRRDHYADM